MSRHNKLFGPISSAQKTHLFCKTRNPISKKSWFIIADFPDSIIFYLISFNPFKFEEKSSVLETVFFSNLTFIEKNYHLIIIFNVCVSKLDKYFLLHNISRLLCPQYKNQEKNSNKKILSQIFYDLKIQKFLNCN